MKTSDFDFHLPEELIAQAPPKNREDARLFFVDRETQEKKHLKIPDVVDLFSEEDTLVFNQSKVIPARILLEDGKQEIFLSRKIENEERRKESGDSYKKIHNSEFIINNCSDRWSCMVRPGKKFKTGKEIFFSDGSKALIEKITKDGLREISFFPKSTFSEFLEKNGQIPLPPYIERAPENNDLERYQTIFAEHEGSVAAPTAGLHFTKNILEALKKKGVQLEFVTLHVGLGTFLPVKSENIEEHQMHEEFYEVSKETAERINTAKKAGKKITAVGSTSFRTLESSVDDNGKVQSGTSSTSSFFYPPHEFQIVDHFFTNFHLPKSTLLMLVAAFASPGKIEGVRLSKKIYEEAIEKKYRFFSYGDATLWW